MCVLRGKQTEAECRFSGARCTSLRHGHVPRAKAFELVDAGEAEWLGDALYLNRSAAKRWKWRPSVDASGVHVVMQLV